MLSHLSVNTLPENCLRLWCSTWDLPISSVPQAFHSPLRYSSSTAKKPPTLSRSLTSQLEEQPTCPLRPINPMNTNPVCLTATAGTQLSQGLTLFDHHSEEALKFTVVRPSSFTLFHMVRLSSIANVSALLPP